MSPVQIQQADYEFDPSHTAKPQPPAESPQLETNLRHQSTASKCCWYLYHGHSEKQNITLPSADSHSSATNITTIVGLMCHLSQSVWTACTLTFSLCGNHKTSLIKSLHFKVHRIFWNSCQGVTICSGTIYGRQQLTLITPLCVWLILEHQVRGLVM